MTRLEFIKTNILKLLHFWSNIAIAVGAIVIISLSFLDYFVTPSNFEKFLVYRIFAAGGIFLLYLVNRKKINNVRHHFTTILAALIVSGMVALMIASFGGHESPYFAGMILAMIFVIGLIPLNPTMSLIAVLIIYAIYLVPILIYDTISNVPFFINANVFIVSSAVAMLLLRYLINKRFISEFGLQYDLDQEKQK